MEPKQTTAGLYTRSPCFTPRLVYDLFVLTLFRILRPLIFVLTLFGWLLCITLTPVYSIISYGNIIFDLRLFDWRQLVQEHSWGVT